MTTKHISTVIVTLLMAGLCAQAGAWGSANRFGGSSAHERGEGSEHSNAWGGSTEHSASGGTEHSNAYGGSSEARAGDGAEHTNAYGGSTEARYGSGAEHTNMYGGSTGAAYGDGAYHTTSYGATAYRPPAYGTYPAYHPPVAVPYYSSGCSGCAVAAGAVVGMAAPTTREFLPGPARLRCRLSLVTPRREATRWDTTTQRFRRVPRKSTYAGRLTT